MSATLLLLGAFLSIATFSARPSPSNEGIAKSFRERSPFSITGRRRRG
jgi:hypothetical protein